MAFVGLGVVNNIYPGIVLLPGSAVLQQPLLPTIQPMILLGPINEMPLNLSNYESIPRPLQKSLTLNFNMVIACVRLASLRVQLPWAFDAALVRDQTGVCLQGLMITNAKQMPLFQFLDENARTEDECILSIMNLNLQKPVFESEPVDCVDICLAATMPKLQNMRAIWAPDKAYEMYPGWRRWYKEFKIFASNMPLQELQFAPGVMPAYRVETTRQHMLGRADVRKLVPLMLQAHVAQVRKRVVEPFRVARAAIDHPHPWLPPFGQHIRTWHGCRHSMMLLSGKTSLSVQLFVRAWLASAAAILQDIEDAVHREPFRTYFR